MDRIIRSSYIEFNHHLGRSLIIIGGFTILLQLIVKLLIRLNQTVYDTIPSMIFISTNEFLYFILIIGIGIPSYITFLTGINAYFTKNSQFGRIIAFISFLFMSLASFASMMFGGGFYIGMIFTNLGSFLILYMTLMHHQMQNNPLQQEGTINENSKLKPKKKFTFGLGLLVLISCTASISNNTVHIAPTLIPTANNLPQNITPNHSNTFFIMPIFEGDYSNEETIQRLDYIKQQVGGDVYTGTGFIKIGRSFSCQYVTALHPNGSFNAASLIQKLEICTITNTPVLMHMNGGNWGQCCDSTHPVIAAMRENISNCQWDQMNYCHPIQFNLGPNDRFWSYWPDSDWEHFRERNMKQALSVIYNWWQKNPDLLVGFSTDSEIHLNHQFFEGENDIRTGMRYKSYFDYNNHTIQQYREWAQANWTLQEFNTKCKTSFSSWDLVDAPRTADVVGKIGNPWWEIWTDFRIWHVREAGLRQCKWIVEMGFPRDMIWNHQILSEPDDIKTRYQLCDPIETAINPYCKLGITRYGWISPEVLHSLGQFALKETNDQIPSWGIFEWNLWTQHEYWAYREMLNAIYQYGGHVICPNEWTNNSYNEGLWIPGETCNQSNSYIINGTQYGSSETGCQGTPGECVCVKWEDGQCRECVDRHGNPQFLQAMRDFIALGQDYERGSCPELRLNPLIAGFNSNYADTYKFFNENEGPYIIASLWLMSLIYIIIISIIGNRAKVKQKLQIKP